MEEREGWEKRRVESEIEVGRGGGNLINQSSTNLQYLFITAHSTRQIIHLTRLITNDTMHTSSYIHQIIRYSCAHIITHVLLHHVKAPAIQVPE